MDLKGRCKMDRGAVRWKRELHYGKGRGKMGRGVARWEVEAHDGMGRYKVEWGVQDGTGRCKMKRGGAR